MKLFRLAYNQKWETSTFHVSFLNNHYVG